MLNGGFKNKRFRNSKAHNASAKLGQTSHNRRPQNARQYLQPLSQRKHSSIKR